MTTKRHRGWTVLALAAAAVVLAACDKPREPEVVPATVVMPGTAPPTPATPAPTPTSPGGEVTPGPAPTSIATTPSSVPAVPAAPATTTGSTGSTGSTGTTTSVSPGGTTTTTSPGGTVIELPTAGLPPRPSASLPVAASIGPVPAASAAADNQPPSVAPGTTK